MVPFGTPPPANDFRASPWPDSELSMLQKEVTSLKATIADMAKAFEELRENREETHEYVKRFEVTPIYDYELIKARRRLMHQEFKTAFKFYSRLIRIRYDMPVAIAIK